MKLPKMPGPGPQPPPNYTGVPFNMHGTSQGNYGNSPDGMGGVAHIRLQ